MCNYPELYHLIRVQALNYRGMQTVPRCTPTTIEFVTQSYNSSLLFLTYSYSHTTTLPPNHHPAHWLFQLAVPQL